MAQDPNAPAPKPKPKRKKRRPGFLFGNQEGQHDQIENPDPEYWKKRQEGRPQSFHGPNRIRASVKRATRRA